MTLVELPEKITLPRLIRKALAQPRAEALLERVGDAWTPTSSARLLERAERIACAIRAAGLNAGDRVALVSHNCVDWIVADFATLFAGCVVVPIYPTQALDHMSYILQHSGTRLIFADTSATVERLRQCATALPKIVCFESRGEDGLAAFEARGATILTAGAEHLRAGEKALRPDDLAVLIYTSGTTGPPKGVMLSHDNIAFDAAVSLDCGFEGIEGGGDVISVLPYSHIYEHTLIYIYLLAKVRYFICRDPAELRPDLVAVRPIEMTAVPRVFDRVLAAVQGQALRTAGPKGRLVPWALDVARKYKTAQTFGRAASPWLAVQYAVANRFVLRKVRHALGLDRVRFLTSGSAPLHIDTAMTFLGLGVPIMQGYGLTETSPVVSVSRLSDNVYGAVGRPIRGVDVRVAQDGEIVVRGRNVMKGYYRDEDATAAAIVDGWFHTGDVGELDDRGFLRVTDRKGEIFKGSTGKWIAPGRIEASIKRSIFVAQAMVTGRGQSHPIALICPNWALVRLHLPSLPVDASEERLAKRAELVDFLTREVHKQTRGLATYEQVRRIIVIPHEFSVEGGELSPSLKIKRRVVEARYAREVERAYQTASAVA